MASEEFTIEQFDSIEELLNELINACQNQNLKEKFISRFNDVKFNEKCPLMKELLNLTPMYHYDLFEIISEFPLVEISFITEDLEILIAKNNKNIVHKEVCAFFDNSEWYHMEEFEEDNIAYSNAKKRLEKLFMQHPTYFNSSRHIDDFDDWIEGASIGIGNCQKIGGVFYCPPKLSALLKDYEKNGNPVSHPRAFSIRLNNIASMHFNFETSNFDLTNLSFLEIAIYTNDVWSDNDQYSFSEIFYKDVSIDKSYEIHNEKGVRLFFNDSDESNFHLLMEG
jgi:hypothetical protein